MASLSQQFEELINKYEASDKKNQSQESNPTIHVDEIASKVAVFYEKLRGIIDWKEEHLLRTGAIERTLKRKIFSNLNIATGNFSAENIAEPVVFELIRGGIFPNDKIEENKIQIVQNILNKYISLINNTPKNSKKSRIQLCNWILSITACEIEEALGSTEKENALINFMFGWMKKKIKSQKNIDTQIYIAVQRALFKLDSPAISYRLIKYKYPNWDIKDIYFVWNEIEKDLDNPIGDKVYKICEKHNAPFLLLGDIISENSKEIKEKISDPKNLELFARKAYDLRLKNLKSRLKRAALYATISIFVSKILLALAVEIPLDKYIFGTFNFTAIGIDAFFPPILMLVLISTIKPPKKANFHAVLMELMKVAYSTQKEEFYEIKEIKKTNFIFVFAAKILYFISFFITLGLIVLLLRDLKFPIISYFIFIIFVSLIAFTGAKLRQRSKEIDIIEEKEGFLTTLWDLFTLPLVQMGNWLTSKWKKYNFIAAAFNVLIDMPFTVFVEFIEQWRYFLKEKKEKIH